MSLRFINHLKRKGNLRTILTYDNDTTLFKTVLFRTNIITISLFPGCLPYMTLFTGMYRTNTTLNMMNYLLRPFFQITIGKKGISDNWYIWKNNKLIDILYFNETFIHLPLKIPEMLNVVGYLRDVIGVPTQN
jgi:hypothetical protein